MNACPTSSVSKYIGFVDATFENSFVIFLPALQETSCMVWRCYVPSAGVHMMSWYPLNMVKMFPHPLVSPWSPITVALALIFTLVARVLQWWRAWEWDYSKDTWLGACEQDCCLCMDIYVYLTQWYQNFPQDHFCPSCDCKFPVCIAWGQPLLDYHAWMCSTCKHKAYEKETRNCTLCHSPV